MQEVRLKNRERNRVPKLLRHGASSCCFTVPSDWLTYVESKMRRKVIAFEIDISNDNYLFAMPIFNNPSLTAERQLKQYGNRVKVEKTTAKQVERKPSELDDIPLDCISVARVVTPAESKRIEESNKIRNEFVF